MIPSFVFTRPPSQWPIGDDERRAVLDEMARRLHEEHLHHASSRPLSKDYEWCGVAGEYAWSRDHDVPMPRKDQHGGDNGIDFWIGLLSIDVKCFSRPYHLLVERDKVRADIYVLARYGGDMINAQLLRWEWGSVVQQRAPHNFMNIGIISHALPIGQLRPLDELEMLAATVGFAA